MDTKDIAHGVNNIAKYTYICMTDACKQICCNKKYGTYISVCLSGHEKKFTGPFAKIRNNIWTFLHEKCGT